MAEAVTHGWQLYVTRQDHAMIDDAFKLVELNLHKENTKYLEKEKMIN